jgi:hypothetical protein
VNTWATVAPIIASIALATLTLAWRLGAITAELKEINKRIDRIEDKVDKDP